MGTVRCQGGRAAWTMTAWLVGLRSALTSWPHWNPPYGMSTALPSTLPLAMPLFLRYDDAFVTRIPAAAAIGIRAPAVNNGYLFFYTCDALQSAR